MRILKLSLNNFKGIKAFPLEINGKNATIIGANETGKTTLYDAFIWLLFGKDSLGKKDFEIKPQNAPSGVEVAVACDFMLADGSAVSLKKVLKENWVKQRGKLESVYSGDITACYIDKVPKKVTEFNAYIKQLCDETVFKLLTNPLYFNEQMKWQDRRTRLFEVCGNVTDADVIASSKELQELPELMGKHTVEDFKKILAERKKSINKELELLPVRIDEAAKTIVEVDIEPAKAKIAELNPAINKLETELHLVKSGNEIELIRTSLRTAQQDLDNLQSKNKRYRDDQEYSAKKEYQKTFDELCRQQQAKVNCVHECEDKIERLKRQVQAFNIQLESIRGEYSSVKSNVWNGNETCPTCHQKLPQSQIDTAKKQFMNNKQEKLKSLKASGESVKTEINKYSLEIWRLVKQREIYANEGGELTKKCAYLKKPVVNICDMDGYKEQADKLSSEISRLQAELTAKRDSVDADIKSLSDRIATLREKKTEAENILLVDKQNHEMQARINQYEQQQKDYAKQWEDTEKAIFLCEQFVRQKTSMVTDRVNAKFKLARFKLFKQQVNGGIAECCETMVDGVTYSNLNSAMRINVGLDIITTLQKHFNFAPPVFIDNAETINVVRSTGAQTIQLVNPPKFCNLGEETIAQMIAKHGSYKAAEKAFYEPYKKLDVRVEK